MIDKRKRVLLARFGLDGHDRGVISVVNKFRNRGIEVIYVHFTDVKEIVKSAQEEDVELIGISSSLGQHFYVASRLKKALEDAGLDIPVIRGGVIPTDDVPRLTEMGRKKVFGPGSSPNEAAQFVLKLGAK